MNKILSSEKFWLIVLALLVLPFIFLSFFIHPSADDLILTADTWRDGILVHVGKVYMEWSGRYFGTLIVSLNPLVFGSYFGYKLVPVLLMALFYCGIFYLIKNILRDEMPSVRKHLISLVIFLLFINNIPSTTECIYWLSGSLGYFLPTSLTLFLLGSLIKSTYSNRNNVGNILLMILLSLMIVGSNEMSMILLLEGSVLFIIYRIFTKKKISKTHIIVCASILIASFVVIVAPGNYNRMESFAGNSDLLFSLKESFFAFCKISVTLIQDPAFIIVTMLLIAFLPGFRMCKRFSEMISLSPFFTIPISVLAIMSLYFMVVYSTGLIPALRIHNTVTIIFIFLWFFNISILHNYLLRKNKILMIEVPPLLIKLLAIAAFILTVTQFSKEPGKNIVCEGNIFHAGYDLFFNAPQYNREMIDRNENIERAIKENKKFIEVPALTTIPKSIFFVDITAKADNWVNISTARYYKLDSIKLKK